MFSLFVFLAIATTNGVTYDYESADGVSIDVAQAAPECAGKTVSVVVQRSHSVTLACDGFSKELPTAVAGEVRIIIRPPSPPAPLAPK